MKNSGRFLAVLFLTLLISLLSVSVISADESEDGGDSSIRGIYIYDERDFLSYDSEVALGWYLWNLDLRTRYEMVLAFPNNQLNEVEMIDWFNEHGVGKKERDNGATLFVLPDNSIFMAIGSGNDKITVTKSKTYGEDIFADFNDDPVLTLLRFFSKMGGDVDTGISSGEGGNLGETLWNNIDVVMLWVLMVALIFFLAQQVNGFQKTDLILPGLVFVVAMIFVGFAQLGGGGQSSSYATYGVITSTDHSSRTYNHSHQSCTSTGKSTTCTSYPHLHTVYMNDVSLLSYELEGYSYRFSSDNNRSAWNHDIGELDRLRIGIEKGNLKGASRAKLGGDSKGITKGDGTWINSAK